MSDIVQKLRDRAFGSKFPDPLLEEAADEIVALRNGALWARETVQPVTKPMLAEAYGTGSVTGEPVKDVDQLKQRVSELLYAKEQLELRVLDLVMTRAKNALVTLTDAEREAIADAADRYVAVAPESAGTAATLRGLLERLK